MRVSQCTSRARHTRSKKRSRWRPGATRGRGQRSRFSRLASGSRRLARAARGRPGCRHHDGRRAPRRGRVAKRRVGRSRRSTPVEPGTYDVMLRVDGGRDGATLEVPHCAGRKRVVARRHGGAVTAGAGLRAARDRGAHEVVVAVEVSKYERRIACGERPRLGARVTTREGLGVLDFASPYASRGGGQAVVFVPPGPRSRPSRGRCSSVSTPGTGRCGRTPPTPSSSREATARDVVLLLPSGLGNSLYTADAEDEAMRAIDALAEVVVVDPRRGVACGAPRWAERARPRIGFHHPDRFAGVTSFFGDSRYDLTTYVRALLPDEAAAHAVNALDVGRQRAAPAGVARPRRGRRDLAHPPERDARRRDACEAGFAVPVRPRSRDGPRGALVARFLSTLVVARAATARVPDAGDAGRRTGACDRGTRARTACTWCVGPSAETRSSPSKRAKTASTCRARRVCGRSSLDPGALGTRADHPPPIVLDGVSGVTARWAARTP